MAPRTAATNTIREARKTSARPVRADATRSAGSELSRGAATALGDRRGVAIIVVAAIAAVAAATTHHRGWIERVYTHIYGSIELYMDK
jgi:hypothetical protein